MTRERPDMVAIIPARGGSKGLKRKNLCDLAGKPLLAWTIQAALDAFWIGETYVSTEDAEIATTARRFGARVINRPAALAQDDSLSRDVLLHALEHLADQDRRPSWSAFLQPTSPLRTAAHIDACWSELWDGECRSIVSVCECEHHPYKSLLLDKDGAFQPLQAWSALEQPRQQLPRAFRPNGAIYMVQTDAFLKQKRFFPAPSCWFEMAPDESIDIDHRGDLNRAAEIIKRRPS